MVMIIAKDTQHLPPLGGGPGWGYFVNLYPIPRML